MLQTKNRNARNRAALRLGPWPRNRENAINWRAGLSRVQKKPVLSMWSAPHGAVSEILMPLYIEATRRTPGAACALRPRPS